MAGKQPVMSSKTLKISKLPKQQRSNKGSVERQMRALIIPDKDLDRYNLHNPLAEAMDMSKKIGINSELESSTQLQFMMV